MTINIATIKLDLTPSFRNYIEKRFLSLGGLVAHFDREGAAELRIEVSRTTRHHRRGEVYFAVAALRLPKAVLRAESSAGDARAAVDAARDVLAGEIRKYRAKFLAARRRTK